MSTPRERAVADSLRIGIVCYASYGGSGAVATELAKSLAQHGHQISILSDEVPFRLAPNDNVEFHALETVSYPVFKYPPYTLTATCKMIEVAQCAELDILHVHYAIPFSICAHLAREVIGPCKLKTVVTLHGTDITLVGQDRRYFQMTKFGMETADAVTAVSNYLADETVKVFQTKKRPEVIYNAVQVERFLPADQWNGRLPEYYLPLGKLRHRLTGGDPKIKLIAHASNFRAVKNIPDVVRTFQVIHQHVPSRLLMLGEGPEIATARQMARDMHIEKDVIFLDKQRYIENYLPLADLFLLPSAHESFGLAALEAMSCGVPVIATEIGGIAEVVTHGVDGMLCHVGDYPCMGAEALKILTNPEYHQQMRLAARQKAVTKFRPENITPQYEKLYRDILAR
ncbi:MAG TPA: N-acetyl-alpha-D-glucosaminyl L-malate synthase BshA [Planctomycetota bacterium]|jgi:N-acetyl-alpha-D-glucosaminyl L-malate synthase BshA|nr:N-acetyl-alpha-D-glucosaminyl L-malate synthase BshA [Planctomycetota bacterium]